jgi:tetratricopeptide (TPR) repeat protein
MKKLILAIGLLAVISSAARGQSEPPYGMSHLQAYSIFYENYRSGNYDMALQFGRWMMEAKPKELKGMNRFSLETQFDRMRKVYTEIAKQQEDPQMKAAYLDTAEAIFDEVFETFSEDEIDYLEWQHKKGTFYQENSEHIENGLDKAFEQYEKVFEMDPERFSTLGDGYYAQILLSYYVSNNEKQMALDAIDKIEPHADDKLKSVINDARDELFDSPEERIDFLESQLADAPENQDLIDELADLYERVGDREKAIQMTEKLYNINPNFENTRQLAEIAKNDAKYDIALRYLKEALDKAPDDNARKRIALEIAETYQNTGNLQNARRFARRASQIDPNWGEPYMRISLIYAAAVSNCTRGRKIERDDRTVYWLVLDYLDRARSVDSSVASRVNQQYKSYQNVMPQAEDKFFKGWETGDTFKIDGSIGECYSWINETTKVR